MVYLLLGEDLKAKDARIVQIKSKFALNADSLHFDLESLDAIGLGPDALKKALITLPVLLPKRLVVVRNVHKLKPADAVMLVQFSKNPPAHADIVLESGETELKGELKALPALCQTTVLGGPAAGNVFDMTRLMSAARAKDALAMLNNFYREGTHPLQIMGALVWFWGKEGRSLTQERFEHGLQVLEEADLNIKRSRLNPEYAVEKAVVELIGLFARR